MEQTGRGSPLARHAMAYVLAGGRGSRLMELTDKRAKPAVYLRRQVAHHRLRAVECAELRHPPHRRRHAVQGAQPDPPPAARLELLPPRAQRELRHPAGQPAHVGGRSGMPARPTPCIRTSTSSRATRRDYIVILAGDHIYKMDYELMLQQHVEQRRRRHGRLPRGAAHGGDRLRRHGIRRRPTASCRSWRSRRIRRACPASPTWRSPAWASMCSRRTSCSTSCGATPPTRTRAATSARTSSRTWSSTARRSRTASRSSCVRSTERGRSLLARRRHDRRLLGGEHRPHRRRAGARPLRPATGRSGPTPRSRRRRNSCTTRTAGAARR